MIRGSWSSARAATRRASSAGSSPASGASASESWPSSSSLPLPGGVGGGRDADAGVGGELVQLVGAALRLDQVGGEHRVVLQSQLHALSGGGGEQSVAAAAETLQVVARERLVGERDGELVVGVRAGDDALAFGGGPAVALERQRYPRRVADVGRGPLHGLDLELGLDFAAGDRVALGQRLFEAIEHGAELELPHEVPQRGAVGLGLQGAGEVHPGLDVVHRQRRQLA